MPIWVNDMCIFYILFNGAMFGVNCYTLLTNIRYRLSLWIRVGVIGAMIGQSFDVAGLITALINQSLLMYNITGAAFGGMMLLFLLFYGIAWLISKRLKAR